MADPEALAAETYAKINDSFTYNDPGFYGAVTYNQEDHGTAHMSVLDGNGMAVSVTSTVNLKCRQYKTNQSKRFHKFLAFRLAGLALDGSRSKPES
jgi:hypothetical protein